MITQYFTLWVEETLYLLYLFHSGFMPQAKANLSSFSHIYLQVIRALMLLSPQKLTKQNSSTYIIYFSVYQHTCFLTILRRKTLFALFFFIYVFSIWIITVIDLWWFISIVKFVFTFGIFKAWYPVLNRKLGVDILCEYL